METDTETKKEEQTQTEQTEVIEKPNLSLIEQARAENDRREALLKEETELQNRKESLHAEQLLGGHSQAGQETDKPIEETDKAYAERIMRGDTKDEEGK